MTVELQMLVLSCLLSVLLAMPPLVALILERGLGYAAGNRDQGVELPVWGERAVRAQMNLLANLPAFAGLVLTAQVVGVSNAATVWGAQLFFWARLAHALIYIAGIPYVRALAFIASLFGLFDIAGELFKVWSAAPGA